MQMIHPSRGCRGKMRKGVLGLLIKWDCVMGTVDGWNFFGIVINMRKCTADLFCLILEMGRNYFCS